MSRRPRNRRAAACLLCALALAAAVAACAAVAPPTAGFRQKTLAYGGGTLTLRGGVLTAFDAAGAPCWRSESGWRVQDFYIGDVTGGGAPQLLMLVWRRGSFGPSRPFWVKSDDRRWSQHIFIYSTGADGFRPVWMASALRPRAREIRLAQDGALYLVTEAGEETLWRWHGFRLERV